MLAGMLLACCFCLTAAAQQAGLSHEAKMFARYQAAAPEGKRASAYPDSIIEKYRLEYRNGQYWIDALLLLEDEADARELERTGARLRTRAGKIVTASVPAARFGDVVRAPGLRYFEWARVAEPALREARGPDGVNARPVHIGEGLDRAYEGEGVVIGVIDRGFHYSHVTFYDDAGENLRVSRVWDQEQEFNPPPEDYDYGMELKGQQELELNAIDGIAARSSHGTHVAGIAGGSGIGTDGACRGIAPKSELVLVSTDFSAADVVDAVSYIFDYAEAQGKPAVVNMSFRYLNEPLDGTALLDQALDALQGPGKILVGGMGNEGDNAQHLFYEFESGQDTLSTIVFHEENSVGVLNLWGESGAELRYGFALLSRDGEIRDVSDVFSSAETEPISVRLGSDFRGIRLDLAATPAFETNNRPYVSGQFQTNTGDDVLLMFVVSDGGYVEITTPYLHMADYNPWTGARYNGLSRGDNATSGGSPGASASQTIGVGSYTTKNAVQNIFGQNVQWPVERDVGAISSFSSRGPTFDGRVKPDVTAPGSIIASAVSSYDRSLEPQYFEYQHQERGVNYSYAVSEGTSMATPMVTGAVALFLEIDAELTAEDIRDLFARTARQDRHTGELPAEGDNTWGYGKLDVNAAVRDLLRVTGVRELTGASAAGFSAFPSPASQTLRLEWPAETEGAAAASLSALDGRVVLRKRFEVGAASELDVGSLSPGAYLLRAERGGLIWSQKILIAR